MFSAKPRLVVPYGLKTLLEGVSRAVLKSNPPNITQFAACYFKELIMFREGNIPLDIKDLVRQFHQIKYEKWCEERTEEKKPEFIKESGEAPAVPKEPTRVEKSTDTEEDHIVARQLIHKTTQFPSVCAQPQPELEDTGKAARPSKPSTPKTSPTSSPAPADTPPEFAYVPADPAQFAAQMLGNVSSSNSSSLSDVLMVDVATSLPTFFDEVLCAHFAEEIVLTASVASSGEGVAVQLSSHSSVRVALGSEPTDHQAEPAPAPSPPLQDEQVLPAFDEAPRVSWQAGTGGMAIPLISSIFNNKLVIEAVTHELEIEAVTHEPEIEAVTHEPEIEEFTHELEIEEVTHEPEIEAVTHEPEIEAVTHEPEIEAVTHEPEIEEVTHEPEIEAIPQEPEIEAVTHMEQTPEQVVTAYSDHIVSAKEIEQSPTNSAIVVIKRVSGGSETSAKYAPLEDERYSLVEVEDANYSSVQAEDANYSSVQAEDANYSSVQAEDANYPLVKVEDANYPLVKVEDANYPLVKVEDVNSPSIEVEDANYSPVQAEDANYPSVQEVEDANSPSVEVEDVNYPLVQVEDANYSSVPVVEDVNTPSVQGKDADYPLVQMEAEATILISDTSLRGLLAHSLNPDGSAQAIGSQQSLHLEVEIIALIPGQEEESAPPEAEVRPVGSGEAAKAVRSGASVKSAGGTPSPAPEYLPGPETKPEGEAAPAPGLMEPAIATSEAGQPPPYSNTWTLYCLTDMNQPSRPSPPPVPGPFPQATLYLPNAKDLQSPPQVTSPAYVMMDDGKKAGAPPFILVGANVPEAQDWKPLPGPTVVPQSDSLKRYATVQVPIAVPADQKFQKLPRHVQSASPPSSGQEGPRPQSPVFLSLAIPVEDVAKKCSGSGDKRTPFGSYGIAGEITLTTANVRRTEP